MIDAAAFVLRAERGGALPWEPGTFEQVLLEKEQAKQSEAVTNNPIGRALLELANENGGTGWEGYINALFEQVRLRVEFEERVTLPKTARGFGTALTRLTPMLRGLGVTIQKDKKRLGMWITIIKSKENATTGEERHAHVGAHIAHVARTLKTPMCAYKNLDTTASIETRAHCAHLFPTLMRKDKKSADTPDTPLSGVSEVFFDEFERNRKPTCATCATCAEQPLSPCTEMIEGRAHWCAHWGFNVRNVRRPLQSGEENKSSPPVDNSQRDAQFYFSFLDEPGGAEDGG